MKHKFYFTCAHKWGTIAAEGETKAEAKQAAIKKLRGGAWCEGRCETCKLKLK